MPLGKDSAARERSSWLKALTPRQKWNNKVRQIHSRSDIRVKFAFSLRMSF